MLVGFGGRERRRDLQAESVGDVLGARARPGGAGPGDGVDRHGPRRVRRRRPAAPRVRDEDLRGAGRGGRPVHLRAADLGGPGRLGEPGRHAPEHAAAGRPAHARRAVRRAVRTIRRHRRGDRGAVPDGRLRRCPGRERGEQLDAGPGRRHADRRAGGRAPGGAGDPIPGRPDHRRRGAGRVRPRHHRVPVRPAAGAVPGHAEHAHDLRSDPRSRCCRRSRSSDRSCST